MVKKLLASFLIISTWFYLVIIYGSIYSADVYAGYSENLLMDGDTVSAVIAINKAIKYNPQEPSYYRQRAKVYITATAETPQGSQQLEDLKQLALQDLTTSLAMNPKNLATIRNSSVLYFYLANKDITKQATLDNQDLEYTKIAREYLKQMQNYLPNDVGVQVTAAKYQKRLFLEDDFVDSKEKIKSLRPDLLEWQQDLR